MPQIEKMLRDIEEIRDYLLSVKAEQEESVKVNKEDEVEEKKPQPKRVPESDVESNWKFQELKSLLESDQWPEAVPQTAICDENSEDEKNERADGIIELVCPSMKEKTFLDFGCGEGHTVPAAIKGGAKKGIGYDIAQSGNLEWEKEGNGLLTTNFEKVVEHGTYDVVLLYDVLDHCQSPVDAMNKVRQISHQDTNIVIRCHPWCSRHGGHCYREINKAFVHLVFTPEELEILECKHIFVEPVIHPIASYRNWLRGFHVVEEYVSKTPVESFFKSNNLVADRIKRHWRRRSSESGLKDGTKFPEFQMVQDFVDYKLSLQ